MCSSQPLLDAGELLQRQAALADLLAGQSEVAAGGIDAGMAQDLRGQRQAGTRRGAASASRPSMWTSLSPTTLRKAKNLLSDHTTLPMPAGRFGAISTMNPRTSSTVTAPRTPRPIRSR